MKGKREVNAALARLVRQDCDYCPWNEGLHSRKCPNHPNNRKGLR